MIGYFKNNNEKVNWLLNNVWYPENFDKEYIGKMNLDSNNTISNTKPGTIPDYLKSIKGKTTPKVSSVEIHLDKTQECLQAIFWYNTACLDSSNFQNGLFIKSYRDELKSALSNLKGKNGKVVVFMTGNLVGKEWEFRHLLNATNVLESTQGVIAPSDEEAIRRIYFGLKKRKLKIINDIKFALAKGADEVILMKGAEEFAVFKKTGIDILQEIIDSISDPRVKYISEGTNTKINLIKQTKLGSTLFNTIEIKSDLNSKSENPAIMEENNRFLFKERADATFYCGGNFTASLGNTNEFFPSGQLMYLNSRKGVNPKFMNNQGNTFVIYPESSHCLTVVKGGQCLFEKDVESYNQLYLEKKKLKTLGDIAIEKIQQKQTELLSEPIVFNNQTHRNHYEHDKEFVR